jgi:superfamily I DNA/RNA helicase/RecB family exonuclease
MNLLPPLDDVQRRVSAFDAGTLRVRGSAGTGKTTALVARAARLVDDGLDPGAVLLFVHNRTAAIGLRDRLARTLGRAVAGPSVFTFHAFAWSLLTRGVPVASPEGVSAEVGYQLAGYGAEPILLTAFDQRALVRKLLLEEDPAEWPVNGSMLTSNAFAGEVRDFLLRAQERLLTPRELERLARDRDRPDWIEFGRFLRRYEQAIEDGDNFSDGRPRLDFAMVLNRARDMLARHPLVLDDLRTIYPHVLVDDFEEANRAEASFLQALLPTDGDGRSAVVAADPEGAVFSFRGAEPRSFGVVGGDEVVLENRHRAAGAAPVVRLYSHVTEEAQGIVAELRRAHGEGIPWGRMAVVVRDFRSMLQLLRRELSRACVPYAIDGEALRLSDDPVIRPVLDLFAVACRRLGHEELWPSLLTSEIGGFSAQELVALRRAARLAGVSLHELCDVTIEVEGAAGDKLRAVCRLVTDARGWAADLTPEECFWRLWQSAPTFADIVAREDDRRLDSLTTLADALARFTERRGRGVRIADFIDTLSSAEFAPESIRLNRAQDAVTIVTAHGAKGREWDLAIVAGCVEGAWPDPSRRGLLLDSDLLDGPRDQAARSRAALEEEERLFTLAASRAPAIVCTGLRAGGSDRMTAEPSRFLTTFGVPAENSQVPSLLLTPREAEVAWRRTLTSVDAPAARRAAALWGLARLPGLDPDRWWRGRRWTKNDTHVAGATKKTSYSRFSAYENCPLQYLMGQVLGLDPETTYQMAYGSLVHSVLEKAENGTLPKEFEPLMAEARRLWRDDAFPPGAISDFLQRDLREIIRRYVAYEANDGHTTLDTERWFEFDVAGWRVRGKIDRIDRCGGNGLRLVDYKTSNSYKFDREAAEDLQLATYFLAATRDEGLRSLGTPKIAELVYVRHETTPRGGGKPRMRRATQQPKKVDGESWEDVTEKRIGELLGGIEDERFAPSPDAECRFCKFKPVCPMWPEGRELTSV